MAQKQSNTLEQAVTQIRSSGLTSSKRIARNTRQPIQPSGKRMKDEGIDEQEQGIIFIELKNERCVVLYVTMLAAGFVIGISGVSIRQICSTTQAQIRSETIKPGRFPRTTRFFEITGTQEQCLQALQKIKAGVQLYKKLTEGEMEGQRVNQIQYAEGISFVYQPPPYRSVPTAAQLKQQEDNYGVVQPQRMGRMESMVSNTYQRQLSTSGSLRSISSDYENNYLGVDQLRMAEQQQGVCNSEGYICGFKSNYGVPMQQVQQQYNAPSRSYSSDNLLPFLSSEIRNLLSNNITQSSQSNVCLNSDPTVLRNVTDMQSSLDNCVNSQQMVYGQQFGGVNIEQDENIEQMLVDMLKNANIDKV
eukprot:TRINITY_DN4798_c0_g1_i1.p1 TRINITY_DN4798_c0_g1~~TRINITY_DN4798_c0_g1_i1.p1  ORF type:complete len:361 (+),score=29.01 TRINITY_DN4798_c0_g1_i1:76-1158(+)